MIHLLLALPGVMTVPPLQVQDDDATAHEVHAVLDVGLYRLGRFALVAALDVGGTTVTARDGAELASAWGAFPSLGARVELARGPAAVLLSIGAGSRMQLGFVTLDEPIPWALPAVRAAVGVERAVGSVRPVASLAMDSTLGFEALRRPRAYWHAGTTRVAVELGVALGPPASTLLPRTD